jgi:hypothetical protein
LGLYRQNRKDSSPTSFSFRHLSIFNLIFLYLYIISSQEKIRNYERWKHMKDVSHNLQSYLLFLLSLDSFLFYLP